MNSAETKKARRAFTVIELLVMVAIVVLMLVLALPTNPSRNRESQSAVTACLFNLRQVTLGLMLYAQDNKDALPWHNSTADGERNTVNLEANAADHFVKLTRYVPSPKSYLCPTEPQRKIAPPDFSGFSNSNLSYFASLEVSLAPAATNIFALILSGDRHLARNNQPLKVGLFSVTNSAALSWTKELHWAKKQSGTLGVLAFADGHCEVVKAARLPATIQRQNLAATRLVIP